jgi:hypothetical protein
LLERADGCIEQFDTENAAAARQRELRTAAGLDPLTGETGTTRR